ncbi:MAG TPA: DUF4864 domain-containing protein [Abditibacterium sp.]|jgi:hypothetical protein
MKISPFFVIAFFALPLGAAPQNPTRPAPKAKSKLAPKPKTTQRVWKPATSAQRAAVAASIRAQLDAFKRDDWAKAATYQSENLRRNFRSLAQFRSIIESTYPQFANYASISFDQARALGDRVEIAVRLVGKDGVKVAAIYQMHKEKGIYRVEGVQGGGSPQQRAPFPADYI